jgi:peptide/nickel transport system substrate-binding protein
MFKLKLGMFLLCSFALLANASVLNNPYPKRDKVANTYYSSFAEQPKTLDPAKSYSSNEYLIIGQILEPPLQYHYLKRPYTLVPLTAKAMPKAQYYNKAGKRLPTNAPARDVAYTLYTVSIKPKIYFQPHPAFAKDKQDQYLYHQLPADYLQKNQVYKLSDFKQTGTRELTAADYVYQIKRLAHPESQSPILGLMSEYIVGLGDYAKTLQKAQSQKTQSSGAGAFLDLRQYPLAGVKVLDRYRYQIKIKGKYPQFIYWLAMPFFSAVPWEADIFDNNPGMVDRNLTLNWYPVGTGPYYLTDNDPNRQMVLTRNPNFHPEYYPTSGASGDQAKGLLVDAGKRLPFIDKVTFVLEKESIPRWNKFLQGYYDSSGVSSDSFDQAIQIDKTGKPILTASLKDKNIRLQTSTSPSIFYLGFNMLDPVVGGFSTRARRLRRAISLALDYEEFISIFLNGRGKAADGPIPPGIAGYKKSPEPSYDLLKARRLLREAGYPNGRDAKTGKPLLLNYDVPASSGPDDKARFDWLRKQFAKLGIQLNIRATQYNRFQQKMRDGNAQIFFWGWHADYPDPENFLFLLYGPNGKVKHGGENAANYNSPEYNTLFEKMKNMANGPARQKIIDKMLVIVNRDMPWVWAFYPQNYSLSQSWTRVGKPTDIGNNTMKYARLNPTLRAEKRQAWNNPIWWPVVLVLIFLVLSIIPIVFRYWRQEHQAKPRF